MIKKIGIISLCLVVLVIFAGCGGTKSTTDNIMSDIYKIHISGDKKVTVGDTAQYTATRKPAGKNPTIIWSIDDEEYATISDTGLLTAIKVTDSVTITVKTKENALVYSTYYVEII